MLGKNIVTLDYNNKKLPPKPFVPDEYYEDDDEDGEFVESTYKSVDDESEYYEEDNQNDYEEKDDKEYEAGNILVKARKEANNIIEQAYAQIDAERAKLEEDIKKQAQQEIEKLDAMEKEAHEKAEQILEGANQEKINMLENLEPEVTNVINNLIRHIIGYEIKNEIKWLSYLVKHMLQQQSLIKPFEVNVSKDLYERLDQIEIDKVENLGKGIKVVPNLYLKDDDIIVQTDMGEICYNITEGMERVIKDIEMVNLIEESI